MSDIHTLSLHDALPIWQNSRSIDFYGQFLLASATEGMSIKFYQMLLFKKLIRFFFKHLEGRKRKSSGNCNGTRSEEHTSELQSRPHLVCRLLLEKKIKL